MLAKRYSQESQCDGKRRYTRADSKLTITRTKAMGMHVKRYHCPWCEWWHFGNEPYKGHVRLENFTLNNSSSTRAGAG